MVVSNADKAQILEDAADLYESEKVEWCQGSWSQTPQGDEVSKLTMCAATAIGMAANLGVFVPEAHAEWWGSEEAPDTRILTRAIENMVEGWALPLWELEHLTRFTPGDLIRYIEARQAVEERGIGDLPSYNDSGAEDSTKQGIIDLFKNTAKELRNAQ